MPNIVNRMVVDQMTRELSDVTGMVVASFGGLSVADTETVRGRLAERGVRLLMVRNKLLRRVLAERGIELAGDALDGNTVVAYGDAEAAIHAAKVLSDQEVAGFGTVVLRAGLLESEVLDAAGTKALADLPDRDTLRAQMLGVLSGPARGLVCVLDALPSSMTRVLQARDDASEESGELEG